MPRICYIDHKFRPVSRQRIINANEIIAEYAEQGYSLTLRQLYYQFVARDLLANSQQNYKALGDTICKGREAGLIDWSAIEDRTRNLQANSHWDNPNDIVASCAECFALDKWQSQAIRPEVWVEKEALVGVIAGCCEDLDVAYFACKGYTSASEMWRAAQRLQRYISLDGQRAIIFHLGDHDPSGIDMTRDIQERLSLFSGHHIEVNRIALNMDQIEELNPPPNPAKPTDARYMDYLEQYGAECWELDALDPPTMCNLIEDAVLSVRDKDEWDAAYKEEQTHREDLALAADRWENAIAYLKRT